MMQYILFTGCLYTNIKQKLFKLKKNSYAVFLNLLLTWIQKKGREISGLTGYWIYNSLGSWCKLLHFWSPSKIRRIIKELEETGVLISKKVNAYKWNQTKWYKVDLEKLELLLNDPLYSNVCYSKNANKKGADRSVHFEQIITVNSYTNNNSSNSEEENHKNDLEKQQSSEQDMVVAKQMVYEWNEVFSNTPHDVKAFLSNDTAVNLVYLFQNHFSNQIENWISYVKKVADNEFLMGRCNDNFKPQFSFLTKEETVIKVQNGCYGIKKDKPPSDTNTTTSQSTKNKLQKKTSQIKETKKVTDEERADLKAMKLVWNEVFKDSLRPINCYISKKNETQLLEIWNKYFDKDIEKWRAYAFSVNSSKFLMGEKKTTFRANFSWLIKEDTVQKILGGDYGVGDRELDISKKEENIQDKVKEIATSVTDKVSEFIKEREEVDKEEFNEYLLSKKYQYDGDRYDISGSIHPMVSTFDLIRRPEYRHMYDHVYSSYLFKKHGDISLQDVKSNVMKKLLDRPDMSSLREIEYRVKTSEIFVNPLHALDNALGAESFLCV